MKITSRHRNAASAVNKCITGESITDKEIADGIAVINQLIPPLLAMGDRFHLACAELNRRLSELESFRDSRKRDTRN